MRTKLKGIVAILLCLMMCPIIVAQADFTPSVGHKSEPDIVTTPDENGDPVIGEVVDPDGNVLSKEYLWSLIVTSIAQADTSTKIPDSARRELKKVYNDIVLGKTDFTTYRDLEQWIKNNLGAGKTANDMVVRDIFDITEVSDTLLQYLPGKGNTIDLTFDLDVAADQKIAAMIFIDGKWELAPNVRNNGDGTVTITFEHFSPVAFLAEGTGVKGNLVPVTGDNQMDDMMLWIVLAVGSLTAIVAVGIIYHRRRR